MKKKLLIFLLCVVPVVQTAAGWSMYLGNHRLTGNNDQVVPENLHRAWERKFSTRIFHAVASDGVVVAGFADKTVRGLRLSDGKTLWKRQVSWPVYRMPVVWQEFVYLSAGRSMLCLRKWDGKVVWARSFGGFTLLSIPLVENGVVYYGHRRGFLARNALTGKLLWEQNSVMSWGGAPVYADGRIYLQHRDYLARRYYLITLAAGDGRVLWRREIPKDANIFAPLVYGSRVYQASGRSVKVWSAVDGRLLVERRFSYRLARPPALLGGLLYTVDAGGWFHLLDPVNLEEKKRFRHGRRKGNKFAAVGNRLYVTDDNGKLLELDRLTGRELRSYATGLSRSHFQPLLFAGRVLLPAGRTLLCLGRYQQDPEKDAVPADKPVLLVFRDAESGNRLEGAVRIVFYTGKRWYNWRRRLSGGETALRLPDRSGGEFLFEKKGYIYRSVKIKKQRDRLTVKLQRIKRGSRLKMYRIRFSVDDYGLKAGSVKQLRRVVRLLKAHPSWQVRIEGHTDSTGTPQHNMKLSKKRAEIVRLFLIKHNISSSRMKAVGYGESKPLAANKSAAGRKKNRRTELVFVRQQHSGRSGSSAGSGAVQNEGESDGTEEDRW